MIAAFGFFQIQRMKEVRETRFCGLKSKQNILSRRTIKNDNTSAAITMMKF